MTEIPLPGCALQTGRGIVYPLRRPAGHLRGEEMAGRYFLSLALIHANSGECSSSRHT